MKCALILIASLFLLACEKKPVVTITVNTAPTTTQAPSGCEVLGGDSLLTRWQMKNGVELLVCNGFEAETLSENHFKGWLNLFPKPATSENRIIADVEGTMPGYFQYEVDKKSDSKVEITRSIDDFKLTKTILDCSGEKCELQKAKCLALPKFKIDARVINKFKAIAAGKSKETADEADVTPLLHAAISGNREALNLILKNDLTLDGAAAEGFNGAKRELQNLLELKCLKP